MQVRHFVFGKFSTSSPEFGPRVVDPKYELEKLKDKYSAIKDFIVKSFDQVLYGSNPYSFSKLPEFIAAFRDVFLYIRFYPSFIEQRGTAVSPLFHCFILDINELKNIDFSPWKLRKYFIEKFNQSEIIGPDGSIWITRDDAVKREHSTIKVEIDNVYESPLVPSQSYNSFSSYYSVITQETEKTLTSLEPEQKIAIFSSGVLINGDADLLNLLYGKSVHFIFIGNHYKTLVRDLFIKLTEDDLRSLAVEPEKQLAFNRQSQSTDEKVKHKIKSESAPDKNTTIRGGQSDDKKTTPELPDQTMADIEVPKGSERNIGTVNNENVENTYTKIWEIESNARNADADNSDGQKINPEDRPIPVNFKIESKTNNNEILIVIENNDTFQISLVLERRKKAQQYKEIANNIVLNPAIKHVFRDTDIAPGKIYYYRINSVISGSSLNTLKELRVKTLPKPISYLSCTHNDSFDQINLQWDEPINEYEVVYHIRRIEGRNNGSGNITELGSEFYLTRFKDTDVPKGVEIKYEIVVVDTENNQASEAVETDIITIPREKLGESKLENDKEKFTERFKDKKDKEVTAHIYGKKPNRNEKIKDLKLWLTSHKTYLVLVVSLSINGFFILNYLLSPGIKKQDLTAAQQTKDSRRAVAEQMKTDSIRAVAGQMKKDSIEAANKTAEEKRKRDSKEAANKTAEEKRKRDSIEAANNKATAEKRKRDSIEAANKAATEKRKRDSIEAANKAAAEKRKRDSIEATKKASEKPNIEPPN